MMLAHVVDGQMASDLGAISENVLGADYCSR